MLANLNPVVSPIQAEMGIGGAVQSWGKRMFDRRAEHGAAPHASLRGKVNSHIGGGLAPGLELQTDLFEVRLLFCELRLASIQVHCDEIATCPSRGSPPPRAASRAPKLARGQSLVAVGVVLRLALAVLRRGCRGLEILCVGHSRVELEFLVLVEPVVDDPRDPGAVLLSVHLTFDDAGHDEYLVRCPLELLGIGLELDLAGDRLVLIDHLLRVEVAVESAVSS